MSETDAGTPLDTWFAEKLMGWTRGTYSGSEELHPWWHGTPEGEQHTTTVRAGYYDCEHCIPWRPTENIEQAMQCATKAKDDGRITGWGIDVQHAEHTYVYVQPADRFERVTEGGDFIPPRPLAELLTTALYKAITKESAVPELEVAKADANRGVDS